MSSNDFLVSYSTAQLLKREAEFCEYTDCTLFFGTWNVNGKMPGEPMNAWLLPNADVCDIYAIG